MRTRLLPYAVAILSLAVALLLMLILDPWLHVTQTPFLLFFGAAIVSAWLGGKKAGAIATILSGLVANYFFLDPIGQLSLDAIDIWQTLLFVMQGILISAICGGLRAAERSTKISLQRLQISEAKFRRLVESNIIGVISADTHGVITDANDCFLNMVGYTREDLLAGRVSWDKMTPPDMPHFDVLALNELITTGAHPPYEKVYITKDGHRVPILVGAALLEHESHKNVIAFILDLTERKRTEAALRESQQLFSSFMSNSPVKAYIKDEAGRYVYVSPLVEREHNRPLADWVGKTDFDFFAAEIAQHLRDNDAIVLQTNHTLQILETVPTDNEEHDVMSFKFPFQDAEGRNLVAGMSIDITAQIRVEKALRESEALVRARAGELQTFMEVVPAAVWIAHDPNCHQMTANCAAYELMRAKPDSVTTATPADGVYPFNFKLQRKGRDIPPEELSMQKAGRTGQEVEEDAELVFSDGVVRYIYGKAVPLRDEEGGVRGVIGAYLDITDRKQAEEALRETAERLSLALTAARMGDWSWDAATDTVTFSHRAAEIFGIPPGPYMTWTQMRQLLHPEDRDRAKVAVEEAIASGGDYDIEYRVIRPQGEQCWVSAKGRAQYDAAGQLLGMIGVVQDVTEQVLARQRTQALLKQLEAERAFLEAVLQQMPAGVIIGEAPSGKLILGNDRVREIWRHPFVASAQVEQYREYKGFHPDGRLYQPHEWPIARSIGSGEVVSGEEIQFLRGDGTYGVMEVSSAPIRDREGQIIAGVVAFQDISDRKQAEREREELLAREKAARTEAETANRIKDEFLAVLSHELRSPLNPILGWTNLLRTRRLDEKTTIKALETIERNAKLQTQLIEDLLDVSRILRGKVVLDVSPVNLANIIEAALETVLLAAEAKRIQIKTIFSAKQALISGDSGRLQQIVWNLLSNAVKFTPADGTIEVRLECIDCYAQIQVKDNGMGISPDFLPHVFEYFRQADGTTTRKFGGLGLGLAIVRHLAELHGGTVRAESLGIGQGATFTLTLPLLVTAFEATQNYQASTEIDSLSGLRILIVDDEPDMRELGVTVLAEYGSLAKAAASAAEALFLLKEFQPDILICDIGMPEVDGYMLMRQVRSRLPEMGGQIPAIALTAYAGEYDRQQAIAAGFNQHLPKPVDPAELIKTILSLTPEAQRSRGVERKNNDP